MNSLSTPGHRAIFPTGLRRTASRRLGFSLVEVTLAIGVLAFALVGLFALLPAGLNTFRQAMDTSVGAQIAQRIAGELQETDYFTLLKTCKPDLSGYKEDDGQVGVLPRRYFDDQGNEVRVGSPDSVTATERVRILYEVIVRVSRAKAVPLAKDSTVSRLGSRNLAMLSVQVVGNPAGAKVPLTADFLVDRNATKFSVQTFPALIARNTSTTVP